MSGDTNDERYDFFLSYRGSDLPLARRVYEILTTAGHRVFFQPEDIRLGDVFPERIARAIERSDRMLALVTPDYFDGSYWTTEREAKIAAPQGKLVMLVFRDAAVPLDLSQVTRQSCPSDPDDPRFRDIILAAGEARQVPSGESLRRIHTTNMPAWQGVKGTTLVGREKEVAQLHAAFNDQDCSVVCVIAGGGYGKSSLVNQWLTEFGGPAGPGWFSKVQSAYAYSFEGQGSTSLDAFSGKAFFEAAVQQVCGVDVSAGTTSDDALQKRLWGYLRDKQFVLVLDGLEPAQYPDGDESAGAIKDDVFQSFIKGLTGVSGPRLTVITSRVMPAVLEGPAVPANRVRVINLGLLDDAAGHRVLCQGGMAADDPQTAKLARDADGHPLLLAVLGRAVSSGDYEAETFATHRVIGSDGKNDAPKTVSNFVNSYMARLSPDPEVAAQAAAVLRVVSLFDRPMDYTDLADRLLRKAKIPGLTAALWDPPAGTGGRYAATRFKRGCDLLRAAHLLTVLPVDPRAGAVPQDLPKCKFEVHPLVQAGVQGRLIAENAQAWRQAHLAIWKAMRRSVRKLMPDNKADLRTLYRAGQHGIHAGHGYRAGWVYAIRCLRLFKAYGTTTHGMIREDLEFMSHFFTPGWRQVRDDIDLGDGGRVQACVWAGVLLIGVNRGKRGRELMDLGLAEAERTGQFVTASRTARNLAFAHALVGELDRALDLATRAVEYIDRRPRVRQVVTERLLVHRPKLRVAAHANRGAILHYRGDLDAARSAFAEAERIQEAKTKHPTLRSFWGYHLSQLLIDTGQFDEAEARIEAALVDVGGKRQKGWGEGLFAGPILKLAYVRSRVRRADVTGERRGWANVQQYADEIRQYGREDTQLHMDWLVPTFLTTQAGVARLGGDLGRAEAHVEEARKFTDRGSAVLFEPDVGIEHVRLLRAAGRGSDAADRLARLRTGCNLLAPRLGEVDALQQALAC